VGVVTLGCRTVGVRPVIVDAASAAVFTAAHSMHAKAVLIDLRMMSPPMC
jgi:hypothetical protein